MLVAGNAVYRLVKNVYQTLSQAEKEIELREQAEKEREAVIQKLKLKNQELDRFAVRVSHDLKTPLITVAGFLGFLEKDIKDGNNERVEKNIAQISEAAKKMGKFVDELLDLSRVGRIVNPPKDVAFDAIVQDALTAAEGILKARQVRVKIEAIFPFVHVDRARVVQVMQNLITNAVKFMGDQTQPVIRIGFEEINGEHIFSVSDNGIGIASEHQERIFELFSKLDPNTDGIGIGLGLVKRIVDTHGGRIWIESEGAGKGSTFKFTLRKQPETIINP
jgi:signal transduction histidine kinase